MSANYRQLCLRFCTQLGLQSSPLGGLRPMFSAIGAVAALFLGAIADQLNPWRLAVGGLALMMVSEFVGGFAAVTSQLITSQFFEGVGFLAVVVAAPSIMVGPRVAGRAAWHLGYGLRTCRRAFH